MVTSRDALLERAEELAAVDAAVADALAGAGRLVVIERPAGIGKSSILGEGRTRAGAAGLPRQHTRGSALLGWVADDARHIADQVASLTAGPLTSPAPAGDLAQA